MALYSPRPFRQWLTVLRRLLIGRRQAQREHSPALIIVIGGEQAAHRVHEARHDLQPEPGARLTSGRSGRQRPGVAKDTPLILGGQPGTLVEHRDLDRPVVGSVGIDKPPLHRNVRSRVGELQRIVDQIAEAGIEHLAIGPNLHIGRRQTADLHRLPERLTRESLDDAVDDGRQVHGDDVGGSRRPLATFDQAQVGDRVPLGVGHPIDGVDQDPEPGRHGLGLAGGSRRFHRKPNRGQVASQIVDEDVA